MKAFTTALSVLSLPVVPLYAADVSASTELNVWHFLLGLMPLLILGAVGFAIFKAITYRRGQSGQATIPAGALQPAATFSDGRTEKFCPECGASIRIRAEICPKCGVRQPELYAPSSSVHGRNKLTAALFALFLGGLGMHKFYLGRIGQGILYLLFFWTFIPVLIGLIEGIVYLSMTEQDFARKYA